MMIAGTGLLNFDAGLQAQERDEARALSELEQAFWICDYTVSTRRVDTATAVACVSVTDELKARKFGGDFDALLAWWRLNKHAKYQTFEISAKSDRRWHAPASSGTGSP
jgi:hypothetical protein